MNTTGVSGGVGIVRSGLVYYLDSENSDSYTSSSSTFYNIAKYNIDSTNYNLNYTLATTLYNSPAYTSTTPKNLYFSGTNEYGDVGTYLPIETSSTATFCYWAYCSVNATSLLLTRYNTFTTPRRADYIGLASGTTNLSPRIYLGDTTNFAYWTTNTEAFTLNQWNHVVFSVNLTTPSIVCYVNGISVATTLTGTAPATIVSTPSGKRWRIAVSTNTLGTEVYSNFKLGSLSVYNTALSSSDALQNYNATRTRFGR